MRWHMTAQAEALVWGEGKAPVGMLLLAVIKARPSAGVMTL